MTSLENIRKRLLWRATHRGIKEMDILVGGYASRHVDSMSETELVLLEQLLEIPDQDLLAWATKQQAVPARYQSSMLDQILAFRPEPA